MEIRKKKSIIIGILCSLLVFMTIGYAVLSQVLTITSGGKVKGNWDIYIESVNPYSINGDAKSLNSEVGIDRLTASIEAELNAPKDYVEYKVVVRNNGNINAKLTRVVLAQKKPSEYIVFTTTAVENTEVKYGNTIEFIVKVEFKDVEKFETDETIMALTELQLGFEQIDKNANDSTSSDVPEKSPITNEPIFTINSDGLITSYNYNNGTNVVVPAEVNGIPVRKIDSNSFVRFNLQYGMAYNESTDDEQIFIVVFDKANKQIIEQAAYQAICYQIGSDSGSDGDSTSEQSEIDCGGMTSLSDLGVFSYNSIEEAEESLSGYEIEYSLQYVNLSTGEFETGSSNVTSLDLSNATNLESIGMYSFASEIGYASEGECGIQTEGSCGLGSLQTIIFPTNGNLTTIGESAFAYNQLTSVIIPASITSIEQFAFQGNQLTSVAIPSTITSIEGAVFASNRLTGVTIPSSVTSIGGSAFSNNQLTSVTIPSSITNIGGSAFSNNQLTNVTIPASVTNIGMRAFENNLQLTSVTFQDTIDNPNQLTTIEDFAFSSDALYNIIIPASVTSIGVNAFQGNRFISGDDITIKFNTNSAARFNSSWSSIGFPGNGPKGNKYGCYFVDPDVTSKIVDYDVTCGTGAVIPSTINDVTITSIGNEAFSFKNLVSVTIPSTITSIGYSTFYNNQLTTVTIQGDNIYRFNDNWYSIGFGTVSMPYREVSDDSCYTIEGSTITRYNSSCAKSVTIPETINGTIVDTIGDFAFANNQLTNVAISSTITSIGNSAFENNKLRGITIPVAITSIGNGAFKNNRLMNVSIPNVIIQGDSIYNIYRFNDNWYDIGFGNISMPYREVSDDSCYTIEGSTITKYNSSCAKSVTIPSTINGTPVDTIKYSAFANKQLTSVTIPSSVTSIGYSAFANNQLTSVTIPYSVTSIGEEAFFNNQLTNVVFEDTAENPSQLTRICGGTFANNLLTSIILPPSLSIIDTIGGASSYGGFEYNQLASITIPASVTLIGNSTFAHNQLANVTFEDSEEKPSQLTTIGNSAFRYNQLTNVTTPLGVTSIGTYAFSNS